MTTPGKPAVGGTVLRIPAVQSPNFAAGVSGWQVTQAGHAEFNDVTIRNGEVIGGISLFYDPSPGAGNLIASISATTTADEFGNAVLRGITSYNQANFTATVLRGQQVLAFAAPSQAGPYGPAAYGSVTFDTSGEAIIQTALGQLSLSATLGALITCPTLGITLPDAVTATGGTAASPTVITTDTWHSLGTLAGYTVNAARYRRTALNEVEFDINISGTAANAASVAFSVTLTGSPNYRPAVLGKTYPLATNLTIAAMTTPPRLGITTAGVVTIAGTANIAAGINYVGGAFMPLD